MRVDLLRFDVDALDAACAGPRPDWVKVQATGPWTLAASVELHTGHRVLTDRGAVREFAGSLGEGLRVHVAEIAERTGARVLVQLDEPSLPAVLAGTLPTASGWGTVRSVSAPDAQDLLRDLVSGLGVPVVVHCCAAETAGAAAGGDGRRGDRDRRHPARVQRPDRRAGGAGRARRGVGRGDPAAARAGARGAAAARRRTGPRARAEAVDADAGRPRLGRPATGSVLRTLARRAFDLADRLGFDRSRLADLAVPTPTCGLAGATADRRDALSGSSAARTRRSGTRDPARRVWTHGRSSRAPAG